MTGPRLVRASASLYVLAVVVLVVAVLGPADAGSGSGWLTVSPELATLPASVPLLPVVYVVGGLTWQVTDADAGGPRWVVTLVYALVFAGVATANVLLVTAAARRLRGRPLVAPRRAD